MDEAMSKIEGSIRPKPETVGFDREAWCQYISQRSEFRRSQPRLARNPFTGGGMTVSTPDDVAEVLLENRMVGRVWWSMSEESLVNVSVESVAMPLVLEWARQLGGEFRAEHWGDE
jgi:hypothetical protein